MARYVRDMNEAIRWFHRIQEFEIAKAENRSVRANRWCEERGLNENSFRYWRRKFINDGVRTEEDVIKGGRSESSIRRDLRLAGYSRVTAGGS